MAYTYSISDKGAMHFTACTVKDWVDVFTRKCYCDIVVESLNYCIDNKGLIVYGYVIMSNHIHFLIEAKNGDLPDVLRDFKKFTSQRILHLIESNPKESRKRWLLWLFKQEEKEGKTNYRFWQPDNHVEECFSQKFSWQKLNYIHENPVRAGIVSKEEEYMHSSAADYYYGKQVGLVRTQLLNGTLKGV
jgi:REP element-mobilizing transposase RayT